MKSTIRALTLLILTTVISSCSSAPVETVTIRTVPIERQKLILPETTRINTKPVDWVIITPENIGSVFSGLNESGKTPVLFALTSNSYENISLNMAEIMRLIKEKDAIIVAYKNYYERTDAAIVSNNQKTKN